MRQDKQLQALHILELDQEATWDDVEQAYRRLLHLYSNQSLASYGLLRRAERQTLLEAIGQAYLRLKQAWSEPGEPTPGQGSGRSQPPGPGTASTPPGRRIQHIAQKSATPMVRAVANVSEQVAPARTASKQQKNHGLFKSASVVALQEQAGMSETLNSQYSGVALRVARERMSLSVQELARRLACSTQELEDLESRCYERFDSSRVLRGLVESYAAVVGLERQRAVTDVLSDFWAWRADWRKAD